MNAQDIHEFIMQAAMRQIATTKEGAAIVAAGLEEPLLNLLHAISGNVSQPLAVRFEDRDVVG